MLWQTATVDCLVDHWVSRSKQEPSAFLTVSSPTNLDLVYARGCAFQETSESLVIFILRPWGCERWQYLHLYLGCQTIFWHTYWSKHHARLGVLRVWTVNKTVWKVACNGNKHWVYIRIGWMTCQCLGFLMRFHFLSIIMINYISVLE